MESVLTTDCISLSNFNKEIKRELRPIHYVFISDKRKLTCPGKETINTRALSITQAPV